MGAGPLLRGLRLVAADLYDANCIALGHQYFVVAKEVDTADK